jgi:hypothetical protein
MQVCVNDRNKHNNQFIIQIETNQQCFGSNFRFVFIKFSLMDEVHE